MFWARLFRGVKCSVTISTAFAINSSYSHSTCCSNNQIQKILEYANDGYDGVIIKDDLEFTPDAFESCLISSLSSWKLTHRKGIWLKLPKNKLELAPVAVRNGFDLHHAEKGYLMLTAWLDEKDSTIPPNASHQIGVGCIVLNDDKDRMLCVQEKFGPLKNSGVWKMPTGLVDCGENLPDAAVREVFEETGVRTKFAGIVAVRHAHNFAFGKSDLFFMCVLEPLSNEIVVQESEIEASEWKSLADYFDQPFASASELDIQITAILKDVAGDKHNFLKPQYLSTRFGSGSVLYRVPPGRA